MRMIVCKHNDHYLYLSLYVRMMQANTSVMELATMIGVLTDNRPNKSHRKVPAVNRLYIDREIPAVFFVRMVCIACGRKEMVVPVAAASPMMVTNADISIERHFLRLYAPQGLLPW